MGLRLKNMWHAKRERTTLERNFSGSQVAILKRECLKERLNNEGGTNMGHPYWLKYCTGKSCSECAQEGLFCELDSSMPCSPDCEGLDSQTGEPMLKDACIGCDAICVVNCMPPFLQKD